MGSTVWNTQSHEMQEATLKVHFALGDSGMEWEELYVPKRVSIVLEL